MSMTTVEILPGKLTLTTDHPASSYGQPVLLYRGEPHGPADMIQGKDGQLRSAAEVVRGITAEWFPDERVSDGDGWNFSEAMALVDKFCGLVER